MRPASLVLLHSPLVTASTWGRFPNELRELDLVVHVVEVRADDDPPYASRYVASAAQQLFGVDLPPPLVLVGHSGAGALLPQIAQTQRAAGRAVGGYVFLDAVLPRPTATRLDLLEAEDREMAADFRAELEAGGTFPAWTDADLVDSLPEPSDRRTVLAGMRPRRLGFFTETLPHPDDWPDAPCGYLRTSDAYVHWARVAELRGWTVQTHRADSLAGHFAPLRDPAALAATTTRLLAEM